MYSEKYQAERVCCTKHSALVRPQFINTFFSGFSLLASIAATCNLPSCVPIIHAHPIAQPFDYLRIQKI